MKWRIYAVYNGFNDDKHALSFESAMLTAGNSVSHYTEIIKVAQSLMKMTKMYKLYSSTATEASSSSSVVRTEGKKNHRLTPC